MTDTTFHVDIDATDATFDVGIGTTEATFHVDGGTLPAGNAVVYYEATQPTTPGSVQDAIIYEITGAGSAAVNNNAMRVSYLAGYMGPNHNAALYPVNMSLGTGTLLFPTAGAQVTCNIGMWSVAQGGGSGVNLGTGGHAVGSTTGNCGVSGLADQATGTGGYNIGTSGWAANGHVNIGGWFTLNQTNVPSTSAALIADNGSTTSPIALFNLNGTTVAGIGATGTLSSTPATLAAGQQALAVVAQQPATPTSAQSAISCTITGAGSASQNNNAFFLSYAAGYTGSSRTVGLNCSNLNAGIGATLPASGSNAIVGNIGVQGAVASATTTGYNVGVYGQGSGGAINVGTFGVAQVAQNSATNVGIAGFAINTGSSPVQIGVLASLNPATVPSASAAIIADNGSLSSPAAVALFQVAGVSKAQIDANGNIGYITGAGGAVSQMTSRTTSVILNKSTGQITMVSGNSSALTFTVNNTMVAATDVILLSVSSSTNLYLVSVTAVRSNSFDIYFQILNATPVADAPVINFAVIKGANS
jgi:hypothetical protein